MAVVNGQLFAVGGFDGTTYLKTIEVYDKEANSWKLCGSMNCRRLGGGKSLPILGIHWFSHRELEKMEAKVNLQVSADDLDVIILL